MTVEEKCDEALERLLAYFGDINRIAEGKFEDTDFDGALIRMMAYFVLGVILGEQEEPK